MAYLDENPNPNRSQQRCPRRETESGVIVIHTAEAFPDEIPPDTGAENVARFIAGRTNYGSYHVVCDSDSIVRLVRASCVAYHVATYGMNEHSYGISAATQAHKWHEVGDDWVDAAVTRMARAAANYAQDLKKRHGITVPARLISLHDANNRHPGFIAHATADPDRRTDPGRHFPWDDFLARYELFMRGYAMTFDEVWDTDGKIESPDDYPYKDSNPYWKPWRFLRDTANEVLFNKRKWLQVRLPWFGKWTDHETTQERYPDGYTAQAVQVHAMRHAREGRIEAKKQHAEAMAANELILERLEEFRQGTTVLTDEQRQVLAEEYVTRVEQTLLNSNVTLSFGDDEE